MKNLENVTIHNFRGLREVELKDIGQVNLLVGVNNCGKTSVLEALSIYCDPFNLSSWINIARLREEGTMAPFRGSLFESLKWLFPQFDNLEAGNSQEYSAEIFITSEGDFKINQLNARIENIEKILVTEPSQLPLFEESDLQQDHDDSGSFEEDDLPEETVKGVNLYVLIYEYHSNESYPSPITFQKHFNLWENEPITKMRRSERKQDLKLNTSFITLFSHRSYPNQFKLLSEASFQNFKDDVIKLLQYIDSDIIDLLILSPRRSYFDIYIEHKKLKLAPLHIFGDGIRRLLHIALQLARAKDGILLIDEIETTIHTEALQDSFKWIVKSCKEMNVQLFATTHSLEAVDALLDSTESASDLVLYRLKPQEFKTKVTRHDWDRLKYLREELGQDIRW